MAEAWGERFRDFGEIHREMCAFLTDPSESRKFLSAFRGSFKTTNLEGFFCHNFCWNHARQIPDEMVYNTATKDNAKRLYQNITHDLLENPLLSWIFKLPKTDKDYTVFNKDRIQLGQVSIDFASLETTVVSRHYKKMVNDDLENDDNTRFESEREKLKDRWKYQKAVLTKIRKKGVGLEIDIGTPFHYEGLIWHIRNHPKYAKLMIPCYDENGDVTFPELYSREDFEEKLEDMGEKIFAAQYLLLPISESDALCKEAWLRDFKRAPSNYWRILLCDPGGAIPGKSDPTAIVVCDVDEAGNIFVQKAQEYWVTSMELIKILAELKAEWQPDDMRVEKDKYAVTIGDMLPHKFARMGISYVEHKGRRKESRIWRMGQWFERGKILLNPNGMEALKKQLIYYTGEGSLKFDDLLDALSYVFDVLRKPKKYQPRRLPSGKVWEPSIGETFEEEYDGWLKGIRDGEIRDERYYDAVY